MKKIYWYFAIIGVIVSMAYYAGRQYLKFQYITSPSVVKEMGDWWLHLDRYYNNHFMIPTAEEFFNYGQKDSFVQDNFPEIIPQDLNKKDFVITSDSSYIIVWLFSELRKGQDTLLFSKMNFMDFLFRKSVLITSAPISDICGSQNFVILHNKQKVRNQQLEKELWKIIYDISIKNNDESKLMTSSSCFHVYFENRKMRLEVSSSDDESLLDDSYLKMVSSKLQFLEKDYSDFEIYLRLEK
ncbi:MAG: hypothetical protein Q8R96_04300 [Bacteroidota bacterium]|nr:hypothetical protein [Bacteroidota bacterium]